jgi:hypothetical protein
MAGSGSATMVLASILALSLLLPLASAFYLPGVAPLDLAQVCRGNAVEFWSSCFVFRCFSEIRCSFWSCLGLFSICDGVVCVSLRCLIVWLWMDMSRASSRLCYCRMRIFSNGVYGRLCCFGHVILAHTPHSCEQTASI